jgi:DNA repair exonuclease SbcCD nuclease subunit
MRIAIINDTHAGVKNGSDIFLNNAAQFYSELFFPYCAENNIKHVLHLGDYYDHRKFVNFKVLNHNRKAFLEPLLAAEMTMDIIPGNHDVYFKNTNDLCGMKESLGYFKGKGVNIIMQPTVKEYDGLKIGLLPWITADNYAESIQFMKRCDAPVIASHLELAGFEMAKGQPNSTHGVIDNNLLSRFELVMSGHYHTKSSKGNIHYLGTQLELTWSDCEDPKFFHVLDTETRELTAVRNPFTIFSKIIYDDSLFENTADILSKVDWKTFAHKKFCRLVVISKKDAFTFDKVIELIQSSEPHELKIAENYGDFSGDTVNDEEVDLEDTSTLLNSYVDAVDTSLDKTHLKNKLLELYTEAQNLDAI